MPNISINDISDELLLSRLSILQQNDEIISSGSASVGSIEVYPKQSSSLPDDHNEANYHDTDEAKEGSKSGDQMTIISLREELNAVEERYKREIEVRTTTIDFDYLRPYQPCACDIPCNYRSYI